MNNILFCSVGRRARLLMDFRQSLKQSGNVVATDLSPVAPALSFADKAYLVPPISAANYFDKIVSICRENDIRAITTLIDPEIQLLSSHRDELLSMGVLPLCPSETTARLCFDKYAMFEHLRQKGINTPLTFNSLDSFRDALRRGEISFPVFMKPVSGSGSVGIGRAESLEDVEKRWNSSDYDYIIQELMTGGDRDADVYVDCLSHRPVAVFAKKKIESRIGGASKTVSFRDDKLFAFIEKVCSVLELSGPCDMDFFLKDGEYYLSEINPRFGGAYIHAYAAGVDFVRLIVNNINGTVNTPEIGNYQDDTIMMMYDDLVFCRKQDLLSDDFITL